MKRVPKFAVLTLSAMLALSGCGMTSDPLPGTIGEDGQPAAVSTQDYAPAEVVKPKDGKKVKIGASFPLLDQFLQNVANSIKERAEAAGAEVSITSAEEKIEIQLNQIENFIASGVDALIVLPQDTATTAQITQKAKAANIPLVYVNRRPSELPKGVPYVGSDSLVAGQLEMEQLAKLSNQQGNVAILQGDPTQEAAQQRTKGCEEVAAKYNMKVVFNQTGLWARDKGLALAENLIQSGQQVDVICANNDEMALGAINAFENAGMLDKVVVGGVDATGDALNAMAAGKLEVTVFQDAKGQGQAGVDTAIKMVNGDEVPDIINVPYQLVTPENMSQFQQ